MANLHSSIKTRPLVSGAELREKRRLNRLNRAKKLAHLIAKEHLSVITSNIYKPQQYEVELQIVMGSLKEVKLNSNEYAAAIDELRKIINLSNQVNRLSMPLPAPILKLKRPPICLDTNLFKKARTMAKIGLELDQWLDRPSIMRELSTTDSVCLACLVATFHGGLSHPFALVEYAKVLTLWLERDIPFLNSNTFAKTTSYSIDLIFTGSSNNNIKVNGEDQRSHRWFVDPRSLGIIRALASKKIDSDELSNLDQKTLFYILKKFIRRYLSFDNKINSLKYISQGASSYCNARKGSTVPLSLAAISFDELSNVSLSKLFWDSVQERSFKAISNIDFTDYVSAHKKNRKARHTVKKKKTKFPFSNVHRELSRILSPSTKQGTRRHLSEIIKQLNECDTRNWPVPGLQLLIWYKELCFEKSIKSVKTVSDYHSDIAKYWFLLFDEYSPYEMGADEIHGIICGYLNNQDNLSTRERHARLLDRLYESAVRNFGVPALDFSFSSHRKKLRVTNAGYISYPLYVGVINSLDNITRLDKNSIQGLKIMVILAYRTGCRISELLSVQLNELEVSEERWLYIEANIYGKGKSAAATRKIPLTSLLTESELSAFKAWYSARQLVCSSTRELLFCRDGQGTQKYDAATISRLITVITRLLSDNQQYTFHHFRHTALTNFHLIVNQQWDIAAELSGMPLNQIETVYRSTIGNSKREIASNWNLAAFAGHSSPEITFASYVHFSELIHYYKLISTQTNLSKNAAKNIFDLSEHRLRMLQRMHNSKKITMLDAWRMFCKKNHKELPLLNNDSPPSGEQLTVSPIINLSWKHSPQQHEVYRVLIDLERGQSQEEVSYRYNIKRGLISRWQENAERLSQYRTRESNWRLLDEKRRTRVLPTLLSPSQPQSAAEKRQMLKIFRAIQENYATNRIPLVAAINYYFNHTSMTRSGIRFNNPQQLGQFIDSLKSAIPLSSWLLSIKGVNSIESTSLQHIWSVHKKLRIFVQTKKTSKQLSAQVYLHLLHPEEQAILKAQSARLDRSKTLVGKFSSSALRYVFFMFAVLNFDTNDFEILNDKLRKTG